MYSAARGNWTVNLSTGTGFTMEGWTGNPGNGTIHVADVNGDHLDDVLIHNPDGTWSVNISLGNNWSPAPFDVPSQVVGMESATMTGHMWLWTPKADGNQEFSYPVQFTDYSPGGWTMSIPQQTIPGLEAIYISASGPVTGDNVTLTVPLSGAATAILTLSTTFTIDPDNGGGPISGVPYSGPNNVMQFVGQDPTGKYKAMVQGTITAWP